jgi:hypothetical protein
MSLELRVRLSYNHMVLSQSGRDDVIDRQLRALADPIRRDILGSTAFDDWRPA